MLLIRYRMESARLWTHRSSRPYPQFDPGTCAQAKRGGHGSRNPACQRPAVRQQRYRMRLHVHLISDSTGETLENLAKAAIAQFDDVEVVRHFWPMVRSEAHLDRIMGEVKSSPGLILFTLVNVDLRASLERRTAALNLPAVAVLDTVTDALSRMLGQKAKARPGRQHALDAAYFARVDAIQFTVAHDDGVAWEDWEEADIILAGVSRTSKTPTSIYLANRGFKTANIPIVPESPPPTALFRLEKPLVVGLTTGLERLVQVRRNRLLSLNQTPETAYVEEESVKAELGYARRMFADNGWPVIDVTRRSIEETAAAIINLVQDHRA
jgi:[pyruvate, water dikinase]-phosphate phosphotransferase / [pyruvate, water dikinase] kinase